MTAEGHLASAADIMEAATCKLIVGTCSEQGEFDDLIDPVYASKTFADQGIPRGSKRCFEQLN